MRNQPTSNNHALYQPSSEEVERAAQAWQEWQFPGRDWSTAPETMKAKFREGARLSLIAALSASSLR